MRPSTTIEATFSRAFRPPLASIDFSTICRRVKLGCVCCSRRAAQRPRQTPYEQQCPHSLSPTRNYVPAPPAVSVILFTESRPPIKEECS